MIRELTEEESKALLETQRIGHLGCVSVVGEPYVVSVNYLFRNDTIYIHSLPGKKLDALHANGKFCLQVERIEDICRWQSAIAFGEFVEIKKQNDILEVMRGFFRRLERLTPSKQ